MNNFPWELAFSAILVVSGVVLLATGTEREIGLMLITAGIGTRAGSFARGVTEKRKQEATS